MWFWLSRPVTGAAAKRWLKEFAVDSKVFEPAQPNFVATPVFAKGCAEHLPERWLEITGTDAVEVPATIYDAAGTFEMHGASESSGTGDDLAPGGLEDIAAALDVIPSTGPNTTSEDWNHRCYTGAGCFVALNGSPEAFDLWADWCTDHASREECEERWGAFQGSPTNAGWGLLKKYARAAAKAAGKSWHAPSEDWKSAEDELDAEPEPVDTSTAEPGKPGRKGRPVEQGPNAWKNRLWVNSRGPEALLANALTAFEGAPEWEGIAFDTFANKIMLNTAPPYALEAGRTLPLEVRDDDIIAATRWLQDHGIKVAKGTTGDALFRTARLPSFHPVKDYLSGITWDGEARIDRLLVDHLGAADTELNRALGSKFLISAVARVMEPGCKVDTVLILEGEQGMEKSTALSVLAGAWFCDHIPDLASKDAMLQLRGRWIIEHGEFDQLGKSQVAQAKRFISTATDRFRVPYGRVTEEFPRQCVFAATINPNGQGYLKDETGARRFWPAACGIGWDKGRMIDTDALSVVRDQLWAEARDRYAAGEKWHLVGHLVTAAAEEAAKRYDSDPWTAAIKEHLEGKSFTTISDILSSRLGIMTRDHDRIKQNRVGRVLRVLGWRDGTGRVNNMPTTGFRAPDRDVPADGTADNVVQLYPAQLTAAEVRAMEEFDAEIHPDDLADMMA